MMKFWGRVVMFKLFFPLSLFISFLFTLWFIITHLFFYFYPQFAAFNFNHFSSFYFNFKWLIFIYFLLRLTQEYPERGMALSTHPYMTSGATAGNLPWGQSLHPYDSVSDPAGSTYFRIEQGQSICSRWTFIQKGTKLST